MAYACVRTDKMNGTDVAKDLVSVKYYVGTTPTAIENGNVVVLNGLDGVQREVYKAVAPAANAALANVVLIASEEIVKDKAVATLDEFINRAGDVARGYRLGGAHQIFSVTADALDGTAAKGNVVEMQAGTKLKVVAEATPNSTKVGDVIAIEGKWIVIETV